MFYASGRLGSSGPKFLCRDRAQHSQIACRSKADKGGDGKPEEGSTDLQNALADVMKLNIKKLEALEHLDSVTNDEKLKLVQKADEVCTAKLFSVLHRYIS